MGNVQFIKKSIITLPRHMMALILAVWIRLSPKKKLSKIPTVFRFLERNSVLTIPKINIGKARATPQWEENSLPIRLYQEILLVDVVCTWVKMSKLDMMRKIQTYYWQFLKLTRKWGRPHWLPIGFRLVSIKRRVREVRALTVPSWVPGVYVPNTLLLLAVTCFAHFNLPAAQWTRRTVF